MNDRVLSFQQKPRRGYEPSKASDIDSHRDWARTSHARTQVELAQYKYLLPRLTGMWTHLERQKGGIGLRGPGETEIETDRRIIRERISLLKVQLKKIDELRKVLYEEVKKIHVKRYPYNDFLFVSEEK